MEQFNINSVIEHYKLNTEDLAKVLFPTVKYPKQAFDRVLKGETDLDIKQIETLASHIGVLVTDLFLAGIWKASSEDGCLTMLKGDYKVKLNYKGVFVSIYKNNKLIEQKISNVPDMTMQEFMNYIDNFIKNYENGSN
jgi:hypothetical protein